MFNQYMDGSFAPVEGSVQAASPPRQGPGSADRHRQQAPSGHRSGDLLGEVTGGLTQMLGGILRQFSTDRIDTGDILLVLIILFLFLEGDNLEVVITLGLMLLLGLGGGQPTS